MRRQLQAALGMLLLFTVITGVVYPLAVTGVAQALFSNQADGSIASASCKSASSPCSTWRCSSNIRRHAGQPRRWAAASASSSAPHA